MNIYFFFCTSLSNLRGLVKRVACRKRWPGCTLSLIKSLGSFSFRLQYLNISVIEAQPDEKGVFLVEGHGIYVIKLLSERRVDSEFFNSQWQTS